MMMRCCFSLRKPMLRDSYALWLALKEQGYLAKDSPPYWWPNVGTFEVVIGAILTQQSKWEKVEKSLENLKNANLCSLEALSESSIMIVESMIHPSGFYRKKAKVLHDLAHAITKDFGDFETFVMEVSREWLLAQKGIGFESADAILCYACKRDVMVVDNYTNKLLQALGYDFENYAALQEWLMQGIEENYNQISRDYENCSYFTIYSRFHGKIVEYMKENVRVNVNESLLNKVK